MRITRLRLVNFRNHRRTELEPAPGLTVLLGANAQGKSSLLEAVQVAASGRSYRTPDDAELIRFGSEFARVAVAADRVDRAVEVAVALRRDAGGSGGVGKELRVNGVPVRRAALFGQVLCVAMTPDDGEVATGGPQHRRRALDVLLAQTSAAYYDTAQRYARAVRQRNQLLREHRTAPAGLDAWDEQVARLGAAITVRRREIIARLADTVGTAYAMLSDGRETLGVSYGASMTGEDEAEVAARAREALRQARPAELARGMTLVGPHRDDLHLTVAGCPLRQFGSRGQQMAAVLALRVGERRLVLDDTGEEPVVLLDDILASFDLVRAARVLELLQGAQVVLTATGLATLPALPAGAAMFRVAEGTVEPQAAYRA